MCDKYSEHFTKKELACKCCGELGPIKIELIAALEVLRRLAGCPLIVTSGYRCKKHNAEAGGAKDSQHLKGMAADVKAKNLTPLELFALAVQIPAIKGVGLYKNWVHIDVRKAKKRALWQG